MRRNLHRIRSFFGQSLEEVNHLPDVLLHKDVSSGKLLLAADGQLQAFDFGFRAIANPYMEMSFTHGLLSKCSKAAYLQRLREYDIEVNVDKKFDSSLAAHSLVIRLLMMLNIMKCAREEQKFQLVTLIMDIIEMILDLIQPGILDMAQDLVNPMLALKCKQCGVVLCSFTNSTMQKNSMPQAAPSIRTSRNLFAG